jgi:hypothetical protein
MKVSSVIDDFPDLPSFDQLFKITEIAFKFIAWCIQLGILKFADRRASGITSFTLNVISLALLLMASSTALRLVVFQPTVKIRALKSHPRAAVVENVIAMMIFLAAIGVGLVIISAVMTVLEDLQLFLK